MKIKYALGLACATLSTTPVLAGTVSDLWDFRSMPVGNYGQSADLMGSDGVTSLNFQAFGLNSPSLYIKNEGPSEAGMG